ncbi:unnamed protein product, partial [Amoebophrya sp. A25]|eukprot:GSA25T00003185001.1
MTEDDYLDYTLYPPISNRGQYHPDDDTHDLALLKGEWHEFEAEWASRVLHVENLESSTFASGQSQKVQIEIPDVSSLLHVIDGPDVTRYRSFDEKERP